jgi:hypothetical protein
VAGARETAPSRSHAAVREASTTYGYGCLAAGTSFALLEGAFVVERLNVPLFMVGLAIHALAIYVTPEGDEDADQS